MGTGFLDSPQMAGAFQMLRANDLIWSRLIHDYLLGEREPIDDLMAWHADAPRMPYRMHSDYLRKLFLDNDVAEDRLVAGDAAVALADIRAPVFAVATERDHDAPWRSTYKINLQVQSEVTYLLTSGGHNAGIMSEPEHPRRSFRVNTKDQHDHDPERFLTEAQRQDGSRWPEWFDWLAKRSGARTAPPQMGAPQIPQTGYPPSPTRRVPSR